MAVGLWPSAVHGIAGILQLLILEYILRLCAQDLVTDTQTRAHLFPLLPHSHVLKSRPVALQQQSTGGVLEIAIDS